MRRPFFFDLLATLLAYGTLTLTQEASALPMPPRTDITPDEPAAPETPDAPTPPAAPPDQATTDPSAPLIWCEEAKDGKACIQQTKCEKGNGPRIIAYFYAEWCDACKMMDAAVFADPRVKQRLRGYRMIRIDIDKNPVLAAAAKIKGTPVTDAVSMECTFIRMPGLPSKDAEISVQVFLRFLNAAEQPDDAPPPPPRGKPVKKPSKK